MSESLEFRQTAPLDFGLWTRIGLLSFGGPAGQIALMHRMLVEERRFLDEQRFLSGLSFCMLLPGPEAQQLATYIGWCRAGWRGALVAGSLFVLPGVCAMLLLCLAYVSFGQIPGVQLALLGLKCAVIAIVIEALIRLGKRALTFRGARILALGSFVAVFFLALPFPLIVALAGLAGWLTSKPDPEEATQPSIRPRFAWRSSLVTLFAWWLPVGLLCWLTGTLSVTSKVALFFSQVAVITFGGAYAVLSYVAEQAVGYGWLTAPQMADGLGLAETTPGPLILVLQFVAFLAGYGDGGPGALPQAILVSLIGVWVLFAPSFFWIFLGAPYVDHVNRSPRLRRALSFITAAVLGVVLHLACFFALHVLFGEVVKERLGLVTLHLPTLATFEPRATLPLAVAILLLFVVKRGIVVTIGVAALVAWFGGFL